MLLNKVAWKTFVQVTQAAGSNSFEFDLPGKIPKATWSITQASKEKN